MAHRELTLRFDTPSSMAIHMDAPMREMWQEINFHEESGDGAAYDQAWENLLEYLHDMIADHLMEDLTIYDASVE